MPGFDLSKLPDVSRTVDTRIYSRRALADAQAAFRDHCHVDIRYAGHARVAVTIRPVATNDAEWRRVVLEFWNFALDAACQQQLV
jgi:hypothetical protein